VFETDAHEGSSLSKDLRINEMIRIPQVRVVDEEGSQLGVMPTAEALRLAQERGYDLVEVAPMAAPPVTRLLDYGQFKYEQARREKEARRHQRSVDFKEIRLKPKIGRGDFDTKVRRAIQFLEDGDRVKVTCQFRGREVSHAYLGRDLLVRFAEQIGEHGVLERQPLLEGKSMSIIVTSTHKPKTQPATAAQRRDDGQEQAEQAPAEPTNGQQPAAKAEAPKAEAAKAEPASATTKTDTTKADTTKVESTKADTTKADTTREAEPATEAPSRAREAEPAVTVPAERPGG
jgi:translation initiation factor IF-3